MKLFSRQHLFASVLLLALPVQALGESPAALVADGQPWKSTSPEGRKMTITFYPDGKARMKAGIMSFKLTWEPTADGICLLGTPRGDACMRLVPTANGFLGYRGDQQTMALER
jgi:hypothetical protein